MKLFLRLPRPAFMIRHATSIGIRSLAANPLRTFLSTLGVIIGTAALVAVIALGDGVEKYAREQIAQRTDLQTFSVSSETERRVDGLRLPRPDTVFLNNSLVADLQNELGPSVAISLLRIGGTLVGGLPGDSLRGAMVSARTGTGATPPDSQLVAGRFLTAAETAGEGAVAIVGEDLAGLFGAKADAVGQTITLGGTSFTVVGIAGQVSNDGEKRFTAQVPIGSFSSAVLNPLDNPTTVIGTAATIEEMTAAVATARAWARRVGGDGLRISNRNDMLMEVERGMLIAKLLMGSITGISLLVGGIGIMNVLLAAVVERTREIGIRRAAGAQRRDIVAQFLAESIVITGAGSLVGLIVGMLGAFGVAAMMASRSEATIRAAFTVGPIIVAAASAVIIGLVFGIYPALKASRLSPIDAMRTE